MAIDITKFTLLNVIDTCSVWNLLSSKVLYQAARSARCNFCCTGFVIYECLFKPRKDQQSKKELQERLIKEQNNGNFKSHHISIEDLQEIDILERRKHLSKGELSSIVFAKRTCQAFLTDDQGARILAANVIDCTLVQTTPHLFGWLYYTGFLGDSDKDIIINEHEKFEGRPLSKYFNDAYMKALAVKLRDH
jgi:hypothetical protein